MYMRFFSLIKRWSLIGWMPMAVATKWLQRGVGGMELFKCNYYEYSHCCQSIVVTANEPWKPETKWIKIYQKLTNRQTWPLNRLKQNAVFWEFHFWKKYTCSNNNCWGEKVLHVIERPIIRKLPGVIMELFLLSPPPLPPPKKVIFLIKVIYSQHFCPPIHPLFYHGFTVYLNISVCGN